MTLAVFGTRTRPIILLDVTRCFSRGWDASIAPKTSWHATGLIFVPSSRPIRSRSDELDASRSASRRSVDWAFAAIRLRRRTPAVPSEPAPLEGLADVSFVIVRAHGGFRRRRGRRRAAGEYAT